MSRTTSQKDSHLCSIFFAPRGRDRLYELGMQLGQQYLSPEDKLIGFVGEAGSGKSVLVKAMFPGLELTNDDEGVNVRPLPLLSAGEAKKGFFTPHTYHLDIRFELAFSQPFELADAIMQAVRHGKRVVVEHFELIHPFLMGANAQLLIGIGEEILVTRPNQFGPNPEEIAAIVHKSLGYRKMAHSAEDLCEYFLPEDVVSRCSHGDVRHGFLLAFDHEKPDIDLAGLESKVQQAIAENWPISFCDEGHVLLNGHKHPCTGPRIHVPSAGAIQGFRLEHEFAYNALDDQYLLIGHVGRQTAPDQILGGLL